MVLVLNLLVMQMMRTQLQPHPHLMQLIWTIPSILKAKKTAKKLNILQLKTLTWKKNIPRFRA